MIGRIIATGSYIPEKRMDNEELSQRVETNDQWIRERTGIASRHIAKEDTTATMAVKAARKALNQSGKAAEEIDVIIVSTVSANALLPSIACIVQKEIGALNAFAFDLNAACTGFMFAFDLVQNMIQTGRIKTALIVGSECLSQLVDWSDRGTCILFGDGAGAAVIEANKEGHYDAVMHSDGNGGDALTCESRFQSPFQQPIEKEKTYIGMNGQKVFKFAVRKVPEGIKEVLEKTEHRVEDIELFLLHQANERILESIAKRLHVSMDKIPYNLAEYGNTSSASIPILLDELNQKNQLRKGKTYVMAGFGAGLSWGAACFTW